MLRACQAVRVAAVAALVGDVGSATDAASMEGADEFQLTMEVEVGAAHKDRESLLLNYVVNARDETGQRVTPLMGSPPRLSLCNRLLMRIAPPCRGRANAYVCTTRLYHASAGLSMFSRQVRPSTMAASQCTSSCAKG